MKRIALGALLGLRGLAAVAYGAALTLLYVGQERLISRRSRRAHVRLREQEAAVRQALRSPQ